MKRNSLVGGSGGTYGIELKYTRWLEDGDRTVEAIKGADRKRLRYKEAVQR